jgi:hypothetical protein
MLKALANKPDEYIDLSDIPEAGVPKAHIVLGFRHPSERKYSGLAVA